jgi:hypothetical protein
MRDFQLNFFFNLGSHMDSHGNARRRDTLKQAAESREQSSPKKSLRTNNGVLPISIQSVYSFQVTLFP